MSEEINQDRHRFLGTAARAMVAAEILMIGSVLLLALPSYAQTLNQRNSGKTEMETTMTHLANAQLDLAQVTATPAIRTFHINSGRATGGPPPVATRTTMQDSNVKRRV